MRTLNKFAAANVIGLSVLAGHIAPHPVNMSEHRFEVRVIASNGERAGTFPVGLPVHRLPFCSARSLVSLGDQFALPDMQRRSFDHLVGKGKHLGWNLKTKRLGGF